MKTETTHLLTSPQRILVIETLYLGDLIHTLPLIQAVRARYPQARLDVLVRAPHVTLMQRVPAIDQVLAMEPKQHRGVRGLLKLCGQLREARYDLVINPGASDRATLLTAFSGGGHRLGRLNRNQSKRLWPLLHDQLIDQPWGAEPMFWQKLSAFQPVLQLDAKVRFGLDLGGIDLTALRLPTRYLHLSPFASEDIRCLPPSTVIELLTLLRQRLPDCPMVLSCGPSQRETSRFAALLPMLDALGVKHFCGTLDLPQLAAVIQGALLHIGPDSGPLHLAAALNTPSAACFLFKNASAEWMPFGPGHRSFGVSTPCEGGLYGLPLEAIVAHVAEQMES